MRHVIGFSQRHTVVAQDAVSGDQVKVELRRGPVCGVFASVHVEGKAVSQLDCHFTRGAGIDDRCVDCGQVVQWSSV